MEVLLSNLKSLNSSSYVVENNETKTVPGRASTAADLVNVDAAGVGLTIVSGIVTVRGSVQIGGAAGVSPIIVRGIVKGEKVRKRIENVLLETERGREHSVEKSPSPLFCYHVLGTSSLLRRDLHHLDCKYLRVLEVKYHWFGKLKATLQKSGDSMLEIILFIYA
jgi:hypothetical protein